MAVGRTAGRLNHEHVGATHVFLNLEVDFAIRKLFDVHRGQLAAELIANLRRERVSVARNTLKWLNLIACQLGAAIKNCGAAWLQGILPVPAPEPPVTASVYQTGRHHEQSLITQSPSKTFSTRSRSACEPNRANNADPLPVMRAPAAFFRNRPHIFLSRGC